MVTSPDNWLEILTSAEPDFEFLVGPGRIIQPLGNISGGEDPPRPYRPAGSLSSSDVIYADIHRIQRLSNLGNREITMSTPYLNGALSQRHIIARDKPFERMPPDPSLIRRITGYQVVCDDYFICQRT